MIQEKKKFALMLGEIILAARIKNGYTQQELASAAGISRVSIANIEAGRNVTNLLSYLKIQSVLRFESPSLDIKNYKKKIHNTRVQAKKKKIEKIDEKIKKLKEFKNAL